jgi:catechol 2,3-dioxygenase-like lactoylglutathione lyase family enzyme
MSSSLNASPVTLDHVTIVTTEVDAVHDFLLQVAGLIDGRRPAFSIGGRWLYIGDRPVVHVVESTMPGASGRAANRLDHFALRVRDAAEWRRIVGELSQRRIPTVSTTVPLARELQLFVEAAPGVVVEFVGAIDLDD